MYYLLLVETFGKTVHKLIREGTRFRGRKRLIPSSSGTDNRFRLALEGSITVEATYAFSIFFFAILLLCTLFFGVQTRYQKQRELTLDAYGISSYGTLIKKAQGKLTKPDGIAAEVIAAVVETAVDIGLEAAGLGYELDGDDLTVSARFQVDTPITLFGFSMPGGLAKVRFRLFTGTPYTSLLKEKNDTESEKDDRKVYITDSGKVYHSSMSCPAIKIDMRAVNSLIIEAERNDSGGKYYPCDRCKMSKLPMTVYVTSDGSRYHCSSSCSALKRSAKEVYLSEIPDRRPCKRCYSDEE